MLKLVAPESSVRKPARRTPRKRPHPLAQPISEDIEIAASIHRAIACGRRSIVGVHDCLSRGGAAEPPRGSRAATPADSARAADLARRVAEIHERLLFFAASVELEMDRLEIICDEIDRGWGRDRRKTP